MPLPASFRDRLLPIAFSQGVGFLCGVAGLKLSTQLITPADYGAYGVFISLTPLGMWVIHAGLIKFTSRHWAGSPDQRSLLSETLRAGVKKLPWLALATLIAVAALAPATWLVSWPTLFLAATLLSLAVFAQTGLQAARDHWVDFTASAAGSLTRTLLPPLGYVAAGGSLAAMQAGFALHALVLAGTALFFLRRQLRGDGQHSRQLTSVYEGPLFITLAVAGWTLTAMNRWVVAAFSGDAAAGFFTLASNLALIATTMLAGMFVQFFQPGIFAAPCVSTEERRQLARRVDRIAFAYTALALTVLIALRWLAPLLMGRIISPAYREAIPLIVPAGLFGAALMIGQFYQQLLLAGKRERACLPVELTAAVILAIGGLLAAHFGGETAFARWLMFTPLIPWLITRSLARRYLLTASADSP